MTYVYVRWLPDHPWPEVAFASEAGVAFSWETMGVAPGPPHHPQMWSALVPNEPAKAHAVAGVVPAPHSENGPDSRDAS